MLRAAGDGGLFVVCWIAWRFHERLRAVEIAIEAAKNVKA